MRFALISFIYLFLASEAFPSTFVGNGGNAGDVELQVTKNQVLEVLQYIEKQKGDNPKLCTCANVLEGHGTCEILNGLNPEQRLFCTNFIVNKSSEIIKMIKQNAINFRWTHDSIEVQENSELQAVDAVTNYETKVILINKPRFLEMKSYERLFLLGHEVFHLIEYQGKNISDTQNISSFQGLDGGRQLLNSIGATLAMESFNSGINQKYQSPLTRSRAREDWWIAAALGSANARDSYSTFNQEKYSSFSILFRHDFTFFGVFMGTSKMKAEKSILSTINASEERRYIEYGMTYKVTPFQDPLSFLGQSYFLLSLGAISMQGKYALKDNSLDEAETSSSNGWTAGCSYFMPLKNGLWIFADGAILNYKLKYNFTSGGTAIEYSQPQPRYQLGVAYGF